MTMLRRRANPYAERLLRTAQLSASGKCRGEAPRKASGRSGVLDSASGCAYNNGAHPARAARIESSGIRGRKGLARFVAITLLPPPGAPFCGSPSIRWLWRIIVISFTTFQQRLALSASPLGRSRRYGLRGLPDSGYRRSRPKVVFFSFLNRRIRVMGGASGSAIHVPTGGTDDGAPRHGELLISRCDLEAR